jgi:hypothetical protein
MPTLSCDVGNCGGDCGEVLAAFGFSGFNFTYHTTRPIASAADQTCKGNASFLRAYKSADYFPNNYAKEWHSAEQ